MSAGYVSVQWSRYKLVYDAFLVLGIVLYTQTFQAVARSVRHGAEVLSPQVVEMRAWGSCAFLMLTIILCIGPLARLNDRFLPILYNRRHFGVLMAGVGLMHACHVLGFYYAYGRYEKLEALFRYDVSWTELSVPFPVLGAAALVILVVMALTSHDFWQKLLGPQTWKSLHMFVYGAYALVVAHVLFGELQWEKHPVAVGAVAVSVGLVTGLHLVAGWVSHRVRSVAPIEHWIDAGLVTDYAPGAVVPVQGTRGERIALVRLEDGRFSAVHGVCAHQGGPLYEGKVIDGCLTCPWHGWQYKPEDGRSPPPFTEKIPTYRTKVINDRVYVEEKAQEPGTPLDPSGLTKEASA